MSHFFHKKVLTPFMAVLLAAACIAGTAFLTGPHGAEQGSETNNGDESALEQLYQNAVVDAVTAKEDEIRPLVKIAKDSDMVSWKDERVLLLTMNDTPELYEAGKLVALPGEVWTFTDREIAAWYPSHKEGVTDWTLRLLQLIGVPPDAGYTHVTAMWAKPEDVIRPACITDITSEVMENKLPEECSEEYREWFHGNILWSYFDSAYPWTRLGYTYDWAPKSGEYGLSEFLVQPGAEVEIEYTDTVDQFVRRLEGDRMLQ